MNHTLPVVRRALAIGGRTWRVETVEDQDALLAAAGVRDQFPFGLMLWESAIALAAELLARPEQVRGKTVLELGAGLGLAGVVAASLGATVTQTDHDPAALSACARTASLNGAGPIKRTAGDWHAWSDPERYDMIIGADIAYDAADHAAVLAILSRSLAAGGTALLADPQRAAQAAFLRAAEAAGFAVSLAVRAVADLKPTTSNALLPVTVITLARRCEGVAP